MGLSVTVGILAAFLESDPESAELVRRDFDLINTVLRQHGLPDHEEPTSLPMLHDRSGVTGFPYSFLHYLRRFYARWLDQRQQPLFRRFYARWISKSAQVPPPVQEGEKPALDPILEKIASPTHHVLWHSDCEGYYVPIDFPRVLEDKRIDGGCIGSSVRLLEELILVAAPLGIMLHDRQLSDADANVIAEEEEKSSPYWIERLVWLTLFEAARLSIEHHAAIHFG
jgi:hypothetical protein